MTHSVKGKEVAFGAGTMLGKGDGGGSLPPVQKYRVPKQSTVLSTSVVSPLLTVNRSESCPPQTGFPIGTQLKKPTRRSTTDAKQPLSSMTAIAFLNKTQHIQQRQEWQLQHRQQRRLQKQHLASVYETAANNPELAELKQQLATQSPHKKDGHRSTNKGSTNKAKLDFLASNPSLQGAVTEPKLLQARDSLHPEGFEGVTSLYQLSDETGALERADGGSSCSSSTRTGRSSSSSSAVEDLSDSSSIGRCSAASAASSSVSGEGAEEDEFGDRRRERHRRRRRRGRSFDKDPAPLSPTEDELRHASLLDVEQLAIERGLVDGPSRATAPVSGSGGMDQDGHVIGDFSEDVALRNVASFGHALLRRMPTGSVGRLENVMGKFQHVPLASEKVWVPKYEGLSKAHRHLAQEQLTALPTQTSPLPPAGLVVGKIDPTDAGKGARKSPSKVDPSGIKPSGAGGAGTNAPRRLGSLSGVPAPKATAPRLAPLNHTTPMAGAASKLPSGKFNGPALLGTFAQGALNGFREEHASRNKYGLSKDLVEQLVVDDADDVDTAEAHALERAGRKRRQERLAQDIETHKMHLQPKRRRRKPA